MNKSNHEKEFYLKIAYTLGSCQMLEQEIIHRLVKEKLEDFIPYRFDEDDLEKHALGKLIDIFSKMSNDEALLKRLRDFVNHRNQLAHSAIANSRDYEDGLFYPESEATMRKLTKINDETISLRKAVHGASNRILCIHAFNGLGK